MTEPIEQRRVLARPWDVVVCRNDHPCLLVLRTVKAGDPIIAAEFRAIGKMQQPQQGQLMGETRCPDCGECAFSNDDTGPGLRLQKRVPRNPTNK